MEKWRNNFSILRRYMNLRVHSPTFSQHPLYKKKKKTSIYPKASDYKNVSLSFFFPLSLTHTLAQKSYSIFKRKGSLPLQHECKWNKLNAQRQMLLYPPDNVKPKNNNLTKTNLLHCLGYRKGQNRKIVAKMHKHWTINYFLDLWYTIWSI